MKFAVSRLVHLLLRVKTWLMYALCSLLKDSDRSKSVLSPRNNDIGRLYLTLALTDQPENSGNSDSSYTFIWKTCYISLYWSGGRHGKAV